jgi:hypothetical protein
MNAQNGAGLATAETAAEARKVGGTGERRGPFKPIISQAQGWSLYQGRSRTALVWVVPDNGSPLFRVAWPDIGFYDRAHLTRCKQAAREWVEQSATDHPKLRVARRFSMGGER